jgi:DNA-binding SARP family transcriptional activator/TolB-like protein
MLRLKTYCRHSCAVEGARILDRSEQQCAGTTDEGDIGRLHLRLFGQLAVEDRARRSYLPRTRKTRALLAVLALSSPKPVLRLTIASLLWSRRETEQARASLRQCVHELQDVLGYTWSHLFVADRHNLLLRGSALSIDAAIVLQPAQHQQCSLAIYRDTLLEDLNGLDPAFDQWLEEERARFARIGRNIAEGLLARSPDPPSTLAIAEDLLLIDQTHESAWRAIIRAHDESGNRSLALSAYDRCCGAMANSSAMRPSPETEELISRVRAPAASVRIGTTAPVAAEPVLFHIDVRRERSALRLCVAPVRLLGDIADDGLAAGLTEEICTGLSRFRWISCVPGSLWRGARPAAASALAAGDMPGAADADFVLDGTIQRSGARLRITSRLIDLRAGGEIVWAARFDRAEPDTLGLQDEVGAAIVAQVDQELMSHEGRRTAGRGRDDLSAQDLLMKALPALYRLERPAFLEARRLLELSRRADPASSVVHGWLAQWNLLYVGQGWAEDPLHCANEAAQLAERAIMLDPMDARGLALAGHVRGYLGRSPEEALALHDRALSLNPNLAIAWCFSGLAHSYIGQHEEGLARISQARRLSPSDPHGFFFDMALMMPHLLRGEYLSAVDVGRRAIQLNPWFTSAYKGYLSALGHLGRQSEAIEMRRRLALLEPGFSIDAAVRRVPLQRAEDMQRYAEGLRLAGVPEGGGLASRPVVVLAENSVIDLVSEAPQSRATS